MIMVSCFTFLSSLLSYRDDGRLIMKGSVYKSPFSSELNSATNRIRTWDYGIQMRER